MVKSLRDQEVSDLDGDFYQLTSARMDPKPMGSLPLMIGGSGEKVMAGIIARQADEWNVWGDPELFAHKSAVMTAACEREGRDPASLVRTVQARILLDDLPTGDAEGVPAVLPADGRTIGGSLEQLRDAFGRYAAAGADEFIVLDGHLGGDPARSRALWDLVITEVAPHVR
ncbi:MAG: LLM class flavin-dependent oxidoreductase [Lapillicoccus sp.]